MHRFFPQQPSAGFCDYLNLVCHDLRHTFASLMLLRGAKPKVISEALGHSSVAFTMDCYSHIIEGMQEDAMALLGEVLPAGLLVKRLISQSWTDAKSGRCERRTRKRRLTKCGVRYAELENNASVVREVVKNPCLLSAKFHTVPRVRIVMALVCVRAIRVSES